MLLNKNIPMCMMGFDNTYVCCKSMFYSLGQSISNQSTFFTNKKALHRLYSLVNLHRSTYFNCRDLVVKNESK